MFSTYMVIGGILGVRGIGVFVGLIGVFLAASAVFLSEESSP